MRLARIPLALSAAAAVTLGAAACAPPADDPGESELTIATTFFNVNYNPLDGGAYEWAAFNLEAVYDTLWYHDQASNWYKPNLAAEWSLSDDRKTLTIQVQEGVTFSDGEQLDAAGLETYLDAVYSSDGYATKADIVDRYQPEVTATGEYEIQIETAIPIDYRFFSITSYLGITSPAAIQTPEVFADGPVGSGPYLIEDVVADVSMTLVRNEDYWNQDAYPFDKITLKIFADPVAALNALKTGQVDATNLTIPLAVEAEAAGLSVHQGAGPFRHLFIGDYLGEKVPALGDLRVRQAINMAFDRETITETVDLGFGSADSQVFTPGQAEYLEGADDPYPFDPEKARELLAEAGYGDGLVIPIATTPNTDDIEPLVEQALSDIGITVEWQNFTWEQWVDDFLPRLQKGEFPVFLFQDYFVNTTTNYLKPTGVLAGWPIDPEISSLIETINGGSDEESAAASHELGQLINDESFVVVISRPAVMWATIPEVTVDVGQIHGQPLIRNFAPTS